MPPSADSPHKGPGITVRKISGSASLTARFVRCVTGYAPVGIYASCILRNDSHARRWGYPMVGREHAERDGHSSFTVPGLVAWRY